MYIKKIPSVVAVFAAALAFFSVASSTQAKNGDVIITEVMYNPGGTNKGYEWFEIYNSAAEKVSIPKNSLGFIDEPEERDPDGKLKNTCHTFDAELIIDPGEFIIIADNKINFQNTHPAYAGKILDSVVELIDSGDTFKLSFDRCVTWEAELVFFDSWGADGNNKTLEKIDLAETDEKENWQESCEIGGTPGEDPGASCDAEEMPTEDFPDNLVISEVFPNPGIGEEFVEVYNPNDFSVDLSGWTLLDKNLEDGKKTGEKIGIRIEAKDYLKIPQDIFGFSLNNGGETVILKNPNDKEVSRITYSENAKKDYSYALSDGNFFWTSTPTPGKRNIITMPEEIQPFDENFSFSENIYLNEILPNPKKDSDGEYIEITNGNSEPVDLFGWRLKDASRSKGFQFKEHILVNSGEYLAVYKPDSKISLNNSDETVYLYNPRNELASSVTFDQAPKNASYNFDGESWKWSKYLTPGGENKFDSAPSVKIVRPKKVYKDILAEFSVKAKDKEAKKLKYAWDFGDGKKSALAKSSHKYLATGKYTATLAVSDDSQTVEKSFAVNVKNSPRPNIEIVKLLPNPAGSDTDGEIIDVKNNSAKKIDLTGWKIATGSGDKTTNHPVNGEFTLGGGETKTITREFSKFSLNNKAGKVQLAMPDGKVVDEVAYTKAKIAEEEVYEKNNGRWQWLVPKIEEGGISQENKDIDSETMNEKSAETGDVLGASNENINPIETYVSGFSPESAFVFLSRINFGLPSAEQNFCPRNGSPFSLAYLLASSL